MRCVQDKKKIVIFYCFLYTVNITKDKVKNEDFELLEHIHCPAQEMMSFNEYSPSASALGAATGVRILFKQFLPSERHDFMAN